MIFVCFGQSLMINKIQINSTLSSLPHLLLSLVFYFSLFSYIFLVRDHIYFWYEKYIWTITSEVVVQKQFRTCFLNFAVWPQFLKAVGQKQDLLNTLTCCNFFKKKTASKSNANGPYKFFIFYFHFFKGLTIFGVVNKNLEAKKCCWDASEQCL